MLDGGGYVEPCFVWRNVSFERRGWETISNFCGGVYGLTPEWCWEIAGNHHGANHVHEGAVDAFSDAVGGAGVSGGLLMGYSVFFKEGGDRLEGFSEVFAAFVSPKID